MQVDVQIPGYRVLGKLGESALTEVWGAYQYDLDRRVNLKLLKSEFAGNDDEVRRFVREAQVAANLRHPAILAIYNVTEHDGRHVIVMEHAEGPSVFTLLEQRGPIPWQKAGEIACHVAGALGYAWNTLRLIHRGVSPVSIRLEPDGTVKFGYIGLSMRVDPINPSRRIEPGCIEGIPYYMSPEQARGAAQLDCRTDMYGLGTTLYHMLTGRMPFGDCEPIEAVNRQINSVLPPPQDFGVEVPPGLLFVLSRLLRKHPGDRYASWEDATTDLTKAASGHLLVPRRGAAAPPSTLPLSDAPKSPRRNVVSTKPSRKRIVVRRG
jgi:serine/threonine protein kinase